MVSLEEITASFNKENVRVKKLINTRRKRQQIEYEQKLAELGMEPIKIDLVLPNFSDKYTDNHLFERRLFEEQLAKGNDPELSLHYYIDFKERDSHYLRAAQAGREYVAILEKSKEFKELMCDLHVVLETYRRNNQNQESYFRNRFKSCSKRAKRVGLDAPSSGLFDEFSSTHKEYICCSKTMWAELLEIDSKLENAAMALRNVTEGYALIAQAYDAVQRGDSPFAEWRSHSPCVPTHILDEEVLWCTIGKKNQEFCYKSDQQVIGDILGAFHKHCKA